MCVKNNLIRMYGIIHHPTEMARPVMLSLQRSSQWTDPLWEKYMKESEEIVKKYGGGNRHMLTKRDLERWCAPVPCGARAQVVEFEVPRVHVG